MHSGTNKLIAHPSFYKIASISLLFPLLFFAGDFIILSILPINLTLFFTVTVAGEKDLDGQHEPKQMKPKTTCTEADEAMTCSQAGLLGINQGQEKN